jgi:predicted CoA-substrate-specific enzyme activase
MSLVAGIDIGSITAKTVILDDDERVLAAHVVHQGIVNEEAALRCLEEALELAGISRSALDYVITTGYGRDLVSVGDESITEITCHADGVAHVLPEVRTVVDVGGQDSKVIAMTDHGTVLNFRMNDRCAAGTGRFLEVMARSLQLNLTEIGEIALTSENPTDVSSTCTVFAESEIVSLMAQGCPKADIIAGMHHAMCRRLAAMVRSVGVRDPVAMTGGVAMNAAMPRFLGDDIGMEILIPEQPQIIGALGAARLALRRLTTSPGSNGRISPVRVEAGPAKGVPSPIADRRPAERARRTSQCSDQCPDGA